MLSNQLLYAKARLHSQAASQSDQMINETNNLIQIQREQNLLMNQYLATQVNQAIKFSCVLDIYDIIQENHNIPDEQIQQQYQHRLLNGQRAALLQNSVDEISEQVRILQNNPETMMQKLMRCFGILKKILLQPISKYILSLMIQKYVTQFVWEKTNYCLNPQIAAGLTSLSFGLFYLKLKDSKKFLHENYIWFFGSSLFIYFNLQQNMKEAASLAIKN